MLLAFIAAVVLTIPDPSQTPGLARYLSREQVCAIAWGRDQRHVTLAMKRAVFRRQGIPWSTRGEYEVDHLIPRSQGGADDLRNLWAQPGPGRKKGTPAQLKDRLEVLMDRLVCAPEPIVTLQQAQEMFRRDWRVGYRQYFREP
jgi:hypothetical protein